jgi:hypothetical protein
LFAKVDCGLGGVSLPATDLFEEGCGKAEGEPKEGNVFGSAAIGGAVG